MSRETIRSPAEWVGSQVLHAAHAVGATGHALHHAVETLHSPAPTVRKISYADLRECLTKGYADATMYRSYVFFLVVVYPILMFALIKIAFGTNLVPLVFPLASGCALLGPAAAIGLYEMSRRTERGEPANWSNAIDVIHRPAIGGILLLTLILAGLFLLWQLAAWQIFLRTMGPEMPSSLTTFLGDTLTTSSGYAMIAIGCGVGFLFAVAALAIGVTSFPLLVDRDVGVDTAIMTSIRTVTANPGPMAAWGAIVAFMLVLGAIPALVGLIIVLPVLGHATWHLYRKLVE